MRIEAVQQGSQREVWRIRQGNRSVYFKRARTEFSSSRIQSTVVAQTLAHQNGVHAPEILEVQKDTILENGIPGVPLQKIWKDLSFKKRTQFIKNLADEIKKLHSIRGEKFNETADPRSGNSDWKKILADRAERLGFSPKDPIYSEIKALCDCVTPRLTHFDLNPGNILIADDGSVGLIDFECARFYDPLWDLVMIQETLLAGERELLEVFTRRYFSSKNRDAEQGRCRKTRMTLYTKLFLVRESFYS